MRRRHAPEVSGMAHGKHGCRHAVLCCCALLLAAGRFICYSLAY